MNLTIKFSDNELNLIQSYAQARNMSVSDLLEESARALIEDASDLMYYQDAFKRFEEDPKTYSLDEVEDILNR